MNALHVSNELSLPLDAVTETFAILAVKRAGKSNAGVVMAEELYDAGLPWVAIDPKGDWWGVRAAGDGKAPGLSVLVFGGLHGDVPLEPTSGKLVADLVVEHRLTCVLDVSEMSKADQRRFLVDFADRLYRTNREPLHVFCEEADEYIPQRVMGEIAKLVGAFETLVKRGGFRGIGVTLITQRSASLNKDVLTQAGTLIAMRTPSPQDRKAVLEWINYHAASKDVIDELPTLDAGQAWVFSPQFLRTLTKIQFRRRRTFDSGATPKVGAKPRPPARLADVDVDAITSAMADTIEKAKATDPKELRKQITALERDLAAARKDVEGLRSQPAPEPTIERVEVPAVSEVMLANLHSAITPLHIALNDLTVQLRAVVNANQTPHKKQEAQTGEPTTRPSAPRARSASSSPGTAPGAGASVPPKSRPSGVPADAPGHPDGRALSKAERKILSVLAQQGIRSTTQVAILTGYSHKSGGYRNALSSLRSSGFIDGRGDIAITDPGLDALGEFEPLPTGLELLQWWKDQHLSKAERAIVDVLADSDGAPVEVATIAALTGYSAASGGFRNALSRLRSLEIASGRGELALNPELLEE